MGSFLFRWPYPATGDVYVTGSFDDWGKTEKLNPVDGGYEKEVQLSAADKKITYKFVVNDQWVVDDNAPKEDDGSYNVNNVLLPENIKVGNQAVSSPTSAESKDGDRVKTGHRVLGVSDSPPGLASFGSAGDAPVVSAPSDGAPTLTEEQSEANLARGVPQVDTPADRPVTRSVEEAKSDVPGAFPETPSNEPETVSVNPIPATGHDNIQSTVTTSKEDYEKGGTLAGPGAFVVAGGTAVAAAGAAGIAAGSAFSKPEGKENLIPESSLPMGEGSGAAETMDTGPFISSSAGAGTTTAGLASKVPLESDKPFVSSTAGPNTTTADLASKVPLEQKRQGMIVDPKDAPAAAVPEPVRESLAEAHDAPDAASSADVVAEKAAMEKELTSKIPTSEAKGASESAAAEQTSYHGLATSVPATVEESMAKANAAPEAASSAAEVAEKSEVERELLDKVPKTEAAGEPAPTVAAVTSTTAPSASADAAATSVATDGKAESAAAGGTATEATTSTAAAQDANGAVDPALADEPAVKMMTQNEDVTAPSTSASAAATEVKAPESKIPETPKKEASQAQATPKKETVTGAAGTTSSASTPAKKTDTAASSPATGEKKKKNRLSRIWHKIVD